MDIKKSDSPIYSNPTPTVTKQSAESKNQTNQGPSQLSLKNSPLALIKVGQLIELQVLKLTNSDALLEIINSKIQVHTSDKDLLYIGQRLKAQITSTAPMIQLKVLNTDVNQNDKMLSLLNSTLRKILPNQQPIQNLMENMQLISKNNLPSNSPLLALKNAFFQSIPPSQAFEAASILPEIFKRSGLFTENILKNIALNPDQQQSFPNNDLKIALLRLASKLRSLNSANPAYKSPETDALKLNTKQTSPLDTYSLTSLQQNKKTNTEGQTNKHIQLQMQNILSTSKSPPVNYTQEQLIEKLLNQTEGALARLQTQQLQQIQPTDTQKNIWSFELPVRTDSTIDNLRIYIEQDASNNENDQYTIPWKVILKFNIKELGSIQAHVMMLGTKVSVNFWVENKSTSSLFSEHLNILDRQLNKVGLEAGKLNCHCDKAPIQAEQQHTQLINETS